MYNYINNSCCPNMTLNITDNQSQYVFYIYNIGYLINKYYLWAIFAFGFPGNLATVVTICRMQHLKISFVMYVALLAIADNLAIFVKILFYQLALNKVPMGSTGCRVLEFLGNFLVTYSPWILVLMTLERLIAVRYPFKVHFQSCLTNRKAAFAVTVVGLMIAGLCAPILWTSTFDSDGRCHKESTAFLRALQWTMVSLYAFVPFIILSVCNFLIAYEIRLSFRLRNSFRSIHNFTVNRRSCDIQRQIMLMLFTSTTMFILLHFPICVFLLAHRYWDVQENTKPWAIKYLCNQLVYVLSDSSHAMNFYLYFWSARKFRSNFSQMATSCISESELPESMLMKTPKEFVGHT